MDKVEVLGLLVQTAHGKLSNKCANPEEVAKFFLACSSPSHQDNALLSVAIRECYDQLVADGHLEQQSVFVDDVTGKCERDYYWLTQSGLDKADSESPWFNQSNFGGS